MLVRVVMIVCAMAATVVPAASALAAEAARGDLSPAIENVQPNAAPAPADPLPAIENAEPNAAVAPAVPVENDPLEARPGGLVYRLDAPAPEAGLDSLRFDFAKRPAPATPLRLSPATGARSGWAVSGRAGPLRWLTPLDGEGGTTMRLGGRVADQPRQPGLGLFNMSLHYRFE